MPSTSKTFTTCIKSLLTGSLTAISFLQFAVADDYHYNNMLIGDRASGLAGAYVSISDDPSGLYYNPAGIVYSATGNISANMNAFNMSRTEYKNALGGRSWIRTSSGLVPNFFGVTKPLGRGTGGFSYAVTDFVLEDQDQSFNDIPTAQTKFNINFNNQDTSYNAGLSYAYPVTDRFSWGITLYGFFRGQEQIFNQSFEFPDQTVVADPNTGDVKTIDYFHIENIYVTRSEYGIKPKVGLMFSPVNSVSLGLAITKTFLISSSYDDQYTIASNFCRDNSGTPTTCDDAYFLRAISSSNAQRKLPWEVNFGGTWFVNNRFLLTGSTWVYEALNETARPLVNVAAGSEYYVTSKVALRAGVYTNMANTPKLKTNAVNVYNEHIDIIGATFSVSFFTRTSSLTLGAAGNYGTGKAQVISGSYLLQDVEYLAFSGFVSASNAF